MEALAVTIFCSLLLAGFFIVMFMGSQQNRRLSDEQEALLPLEDDFLPHPGKVNTASKAAIISPVTKNHHS